MRFIEQLKLDAGEIATRLQATKPSLHEEERAIQERLSQLHLQMKHVSLSLERLGNYQPALGADFSCPYCWITAGQVSRLFNRESSDDHDIFRCSICNHSIAFKVAG